MQWGSACAACRGLLSLSLPWAAGPPKAASGCTAAPPSHRLTQEDPQTILTSLPNLSSAEGLRGRRQDASARSCAPPALVPGFPARARGWGRGGRAPGAPPLRARRPRVGPGFGARGGGRLGAGRGREVARREAPRPVPRHGRRAERPVSRPCVRAPAFPAAAPRRQRQVGRERARPRVGGCGGGRDRGARGAVGGSGRPRRGPGGAGSPVAACSGRRCRRLPEANLGRRGPPVGLRVSGFHSWRTV